MEQKGTKLVDAIEEGRIVKVSEEYAKREGLLILRKSDSSLFETAPKSARKRDEEEDKIFGIDNLRKPLHWTKQQVVTELVDNFQWEIASARRKRNLSRKQVALALGERESAIKMLENGLLPYNDFILINKIQDFFKINLRKDGKNFAGSPRTLVNDKASDGMDIKRTLASDIKVFD